MKEKDAQAAFGRWLKKGGCLSSCVFELKLVKGTSLALDRVSDKQAANLRAASDGTGVYHKIQDFPYSTVNKTTGKAMRFALEKPFDCFWLTDVDAFLAVVHYIPRRPFVFYFVAIDVWDKLVAECREKNVKSVKIERIGQCSAWMLSIDREGNSVSAG